MVQEEKRCNYYQIRNGEKMIHNYLLPVINDIMHIFSYLIAFIYLVLILWLALYGINNLVSAILYLRIKKTFKDKEHVSPPKEWPPVTIQLPIFNEKYTVERLLSAVTRMDYPADCLQIQVLDDSTDDTAELVNRLVDEYKSQGVNIEWLHRTNRKGYKAGALDEGLSLCDWRFDSHF